MQKKEQINNPELEPIYHKVCISINNCYTTKVHTEDQNLPFAAL